MKYTYVYKTSDGIRHEDSMDASSREEVFETLRAKGIKAIKVVAADGSKANGEMHGVRKRVVTTLVVLVAVLAGLVVYLLERNAENSQLTTLNSQLASPRHQIYGDPAVMANFERGDFADALPHEGDRLLAIFAQPGKLMCAKGVNPHRLDSFPTGRSPSPATTTGVFEEYAMKELSSEKDIVIAESDPREVRELKQIVNGMREEMREYLANGKGTPRSYWRRLNERTISEMRIYERTRDELEKEASSAAWEQKNDALRRLGLQTIPNPNE